MANDRLYPVYGYVQPDSTVKLLTNQIASVNFDGKMDRSVEYKLIPNVVPGDAIYINDDETTLPLIISKVELDEVAGTDGTLGYNLYYINADGQEVLYPYGSNADGSYAVTDQITVTYEDPAISSYGTTGWAITKAGNAIFSNVFARGEIHATTGSIEGLLTIGDPNKQPVSFGSSLSLPNASSPYNTYSYSGMIINDNNYFLSYDPSAAVTISGASVSSSTTDSGLSTVKIYLNATTLAAGDLIDFYGFGGDYTSLNRTINIDTKDSGNAYITVIVPRITAASNVTTSAVTSAIGRQVGTFQDLAITRIDITDVANVSTVDITFVSSTHNYSVGDYVTISSITDTSFKDMNGSFVISAVPDTTHFRVSNVGLAAAVGNYTFTGSAKKQSTSLNAIFKVGTGSNYMQYTNNPDQLTVTGTINANTGYFQTGYLGGITDGWKISTNTIESVGGTNKVYLVNGTTPKITISSNSTSKGSQSSVDTPFYADGTGAFSLGTSLVFNPAPSGSVYINKTATFSSGATTITIDSSSTSIKKAMTVVGVGIASGTYVTDISGTTITISSATLSAQTNIPVAFMTDEYAELTVAGKIRGVVESVNKIISPRLTTIASQVIINTTAQTATFTTAGHAFLVNERVLIEGLPATNGLNNLNVERVLLSGGDSVTLIVSTSGISGLTDGTVSISANISLRELTMGLHPNQGTSGDAWYHSAGTGVQLDRYNWWLTNAQFRVGSSSNYMLFMNNNLTVSGTINAAAGNFAGYMTVNNGTMKFGKGVSGAYDGLYINPDNYWFNGGYFKAGNSSKYIVWDGSALTITGIVNALAGGTIGGFLIGSTSLTAGTGTSAIGLNTTGYPFYAGNTTPSLAPFSVTSTGSVKVLDLDARGSGTGSSTIKIGYDSSSGSGGRSRYLDIAPAQKNIGYYINDTFVYNLKSSASINFKDSSANITDYTMYEDPYIISSFLTRSEAHAADAPGAFNDLSISGAKMYNNDYLSSVTGSGTPQLHLFSQEDWKLTVTAVTISGSVGSKIATVTVTVDPALYVNTGGWASILFDGLTGNSSVLNGNKTLTVVLNSVNSTTKQFAVETVPDNAINGTYTSLNGTVQALYPGSVINLRAHDINLDSFLKFWRERESSANGYFSEYLSVGVDQSEFNSSSGQTSFIINNTYGSFSQSILKLVATRPQASQYNFIEAFSNDGLDKEFYITGQGFAYADGTWNGNGADYAEFFEWNDGNINNEDRVGLVVAINSSGKIEEFNELIHEEKNIIGVVSAKPSFAGNSASLYWKDKYLKDDFGRNVYENYSVISWRDEKNKLVSYELDNVPENVVIPEDHNIATEDENGVVFKRKILNSEFNSEIKYLSREERPEWDMIGLIGILRIKKNQYKPSKWTKIKDISNNVEEWFIK